MIDKNDIIYKMNERGFEQYLSSNNSNSIIFMLKPNMKYGRFDIPRYTIEVKLENGDFKATYIIPFSVNTITTNWCGSVMLDDHFDSITGKFEMQISILNRYIVN